MRSYARFNPMIRRGTRLRITLDGEVMSVNRAGSVLRFRPDATCGELAFSALDKVGIKIDGELGADDDLIIKEAEEAVANIEDRNSLAHGYYYMDATGQVYEYSVQNSDRPFRHFGNEWYIGSASFDTPIRPLRSVSVQVGIVDEEPVYRMGTIYLDREGDRFLRTNDNRWAHLSPTGRISYEVPPVKPMRDPV